MELNLAHASTSRLRCARIRRASDPVGISRASGCQHRDKMFINMARIASQPSPCHGHLDTVFISLRSRLCTCHFCHLNASSRCHSAAQAKPICLGAPLAAYTVTVFGCTPSRLAASRLLIFIAASHRENASGDIKSLFEDTGRRIAHTYCDLRGRASLAFLRLQLDQLAVVLK